MNLGLDLGEHRPLLAVIGAAKREIAPTKFAVLKGNHYLTQSVRTLWGADVLAELEVVFGYAACGFMADCHGFILWLFDNRESFWTFTFLDEAKMPDGIFIAAVVPRFDNQRHNVT